MSGALSEEEDVEVEDTLPPGGQLSRLLAPTYARCPHCSQPKPPHLVCGNCGWYKGREAVEVD